MLEIRNLYAGYVRDKPILKGLSLTIDNGETVVIFGRNGSGKSTLLKAIFNLLPFIEGEILLNGVSLKNGDTYKIGRMGLGYFQQGGVVFPSLTVQENLSVAKRNIHSGDIVVFNERLDEICGLLNLNRILKQKGTFLSGGEKHILALAMILIQNPTLLIIDEATAGLSEISITNFISALQLFPNLTKLVIEQNLHSPFYTVIGKKLVLNEGILSGS